MKKGISALLALVLCLGCFTGCARSIDNSAYVPTGNAILMEGEEPEEETIAPDSQDLTLAYYPDRSMNPLYGSDYTNRVVMSLMYQGLFAVDAKNNTTPILCSSYHVTPDNRTWTIYLEPDATFSDGTRVTVQDVVASYEQARGNVYYKGRFTHIARVELSSDGGVDFSWIRRIRIWRCCWISPLSRPRRCPPTTRWVPAPIPWRRASAGSICSGS